MIAVGGAQSRSLPWGLAQEMGVIALGYVTEPIASAQLKSDKIKQS